MKRNKALICVSVGVSLLSEALDLAVREGRSADVVEVRLDCLNKKEITPFFTATSTPLLFTNRPDWEGGYFTGSETERLSSLVQAVAAGAALVDCELRAPEDSRSLLKDRTAATDTKLILSYHDFEKTPDQAELHKVLEEMHRQGAGVGKIVTMAHDYLDVLRVLDLQEMAAELDFPLIAFCMGTAGMISRLATVELGGYMTYCSPADGKNTAPGQISVSELRSMLTLMG